MEWLTSEAGMVFVSIVVTAVGGLLLYAGKGMSDRISGVERSLSTALADLKTSLTKELDDIENARKADVLENRQRFAELLSHYVTKEEALKSFVAIPTFDRSKETMYGKIDKLEERAASLETRIASVQRGNGAH